MFLKGGDSTSFPRVPVLALFLPTAHGALPELLSKPGLP